MANTNSNSIMEGLLASLPKKTLDLTRGQEVEGEVILITDREIVLDLTLKSEGIILIREITDPEVLKKIKLGDKLKAFVSEVDNVSNQINLSLHKSSRPSAPGSKSRPESAFNFEKISEKYSDKIVKGAVTKVTQFGVFVELEPGLEGLIHISKLGPDDDFKPGETISVSVDSVDAERHRIALSPVITSTKGLIYK